MQQLFEQLAAVSAAPDYNGAYLLGNYARQYLIELQDSTPVERNLLVGVISRAAAVEALGRRSTGGTPYHSRLQEAAGKLLRHMRAGQRSDPTEVYAPGG